MIANGSEIRLALTCLNYCPKCGHALVDVKKVSKSRVSDGKESVENYIDCSNKDCDFSIYVPERK